MINYDERKLPIIKRKGLSRKSTLLINKIQKSKTKTNQSENQKRKKKLSLNSHEGGNIQKRSPSQKKLSLKKAPTEKIFKTLKLSERNTDDNSEQEGICETFEEIMKKDMMFQPLTERAIDILKNMRQVEKISKLYKKDKINNKETDNSGQNKKKLKNKYKCLVNQHVFIRKSKHNNSDGAKLDSNKGKNHESIDDDFWEKINESLILESYKHEDPSKQLVDLVDNIMTEY